MRLGYFDLETIDCTADPHKVSYNCISEMLSDILLVCQSNLVLSVERVSLDIQNFKGNKIYYEVKDQWARPYSRPLLSGIEGVKQASKIVEDTLKQKYLFPVEMRVSVIWAFAGKDSCPSIITAYFRENVVDYSNQDWFITEKGYKKHCKELSKLIGKTIKPTSLTE